MEESSLPTPHDILLAALESEERAYRFYASLLTQCQTETVRRLVELLRDEEYKHQALIQNMIARLNLGREVV